MRPRYASRRPYQMIESALAGARSYDAFASASCVSYRALVSAESGNVRSVSPRKEMACAPGGRGERAVMAGRGVAVQATSVAARARRARCMARRYANAVADDQSSCRIERMHSTTPLRAVATIIAACVLCVLLVRYASVLPAVV